MKLQTVWRHDGWHIGIIEAPADALLQPDALPPVHWLDIPAKHAFVADPFLIDHAGTTYCFFEELPYRTNRGVISYVALDPTYRGRHTVHRAIEEPHHLSYPFLVHDGEEIVCVPEGSASGRIVAYAARAFPGDWYRKATLVEFPGVDSTIFRHNDRWWLLCTDGRTRWNGELYAFYADDFYGAWKPHAGNPIVSDPSHARPGGRPFTAGGRLYRPAQNCSVTYGGSLSIVEILELSPQRYAERRVAEIVPDARGAFRDGLHTACAEGTRIAIDGNRYRFELQQAARAIGAKVRSLGRRVAPPQG